MAVVKKLFYFSSPVFLLAFIFFQNFTPLLNHTATIGYHAVAAPIPAKVMHKPEPGIDLAKLKQGVYYSYKSDYSCADPKMPTSPALPSHLDSYSIAGGKICRLGDRCTEPGKCTTKIPAGMTVTKDSGLKINGREFRWQENPYPAECGMPSCSAPPDSCKYLAPAPLNDKGCTLGCGSMACKGVNPKCPELECAVPPANCAYDNQGSRDAANCPISCGTIICDSVSEEVNCPKVECATPPENCRYDRSFQKDAKGCKTSCGNLSCDRPDPKKPVCKIIECALPPPGCNYEGALPRDENGCATSCGSLACVKTVPKICKIPKCDVPPSNCRYDGNSPLDFEGCSRDCGNLICNVKD